MKRNIYPVLFLIFLIACLTFSIICLKAANKDRAGKNTSPTSQINEVQRSLDKLGKKVQANTNGLIALNDEFVGDGSEGYYDFEPEEYYNSYGIDDIPREGE
jgi:hypothetical protein